MIFFLAGCFFLSVAYFANLIWARTRAAPLREFAIAHFAPNPNHIYEAKSWELPVLNIIHQYIWVEGWLFEITVNLLSGVMFFQVDVCCFQRISWLTYIFQANFFLSKQIWYFLRIAVTLQHFLFPVGFPISNSLWSILPVSANHWFPLVSLHGSCNTNNCKKKQ